MYILWPSINLKIQNLAFLYPLRLANQYIDVNRYTVYFDSTYLIMTYIHNQK